MIAIIDYDMGNVRSTFNAFKLFGEDVEITDDHDKISQSEAIVLPGVGSFADGINILKKKQLIPLLEKEVLKNKKPYFGICLGLEFLARKSFEGGETKGFGWLNGDIIKIVPNDPNLKVPQMGWNDTMIRNGKDLFKEITEPTFYYTHSYFL